MHPFTLIDRSDLSPANWMDKEGEDRVFVAKLVIYSLWEGSYGADTTPIKNKFRGQAGLHGWI
jgi:hypothetical protein